MKRLEYTHTYIHTYTFRPIILRTATRSATHGKILTQEMHSKAKNYLTFHSPTSNARRRRYRLFHFRFAIITDIFTFRQSLNYIPSIFAFNIIAVIMPSHREIVRSGSSSGIAHRYHYHVITTWQQFLFAPFFLLSVVVSSLFLSVWRSSALCLSACSRSERR